MQADDVVTQCTLLSDSLGAFRLPTLSELCRYRIIVCTCIASAFVLRYKGHALSCPLSITHLFIDEAGQAPLLEALLPMLLVKEARGSVCVAGDPRQLGPVIRSPVAAVAGLEESMLERLIDYYQALPERLPARYMCTLLVRNYRSHERLLKLPSDLFYGSALQAAADQKATRAPPWSVLGTVRVFLGCLRILHWQQWGPCLVVVACVLGVTRSQCPAACVYILNDFTTQHTCVHRWADVHAARELPPITTHACCCVSLGSALAAPMIPAACFPPYNRLTGILEDNLTVEFTVDNDPDAVNNTFVVPTFGEQRRLDDSSAFYNATEAEVLVCLLDSLLAEHRKLEAAKAVAEPVTTGDVGVICLSRAQAVHIRNLLRRRQLAAVNVGTVDDFQGQEMQVIFISTVLTCSVRCVGF